MQFVLKLLMHREISISIETGLKIGWVNMDHQKLISKSVWNAKMSATSEKKKKKV